MYKYVGNVIMFTINITPLSHQNKSKKNEMWV